MNKSIYEQVEEYMGYCRYVRNMSQTTIANKRHTYKHFVFDSECSDLTELENVHFTKWVECQIKRGVSARTVNIRMANVLSLLRYHREMGLSMPIKLPLIQKLKEGPARRVFYSRSQIEQALMFADELAWLLIRICFDAGLRISELRNLRLDNFFGQRIKFVGKGSRDRESYISHETYERLQRWIKNHNINSVIWLDKKGCQYSVDELRRKMRKPFYEAGFTDFYPHALRHSFGTDLQRKGASLLELQKMLGHSNSTTTERYIHGLDGRLEDLFVKYGQDELTAK
jgi:site-specific recombinase XerD